MTPHRLCVRRGVPGHARGHRDRSVVRLRYVAAWLVVLCMFSTTVLAAEVRFGVVMDVPRNEYSSGFLDRLAGEMKKTLGSSYELRLDNADILSTDWDYSQTLAHYRALVERCDVIVLLGSGAIREVVSGGNFPRPTLGLGVFDPRTQGVPYEEIGVSGVKNFSYVLTSQDLHKELALFRRITPFENLALLLDRRFASIFPESHEPIQTLAALLDAHIDVVFLDEDIEASLLEIPEATDAVYLWVPYGMEPADLELVAAHLIDRGLPSFAANREAVNAGLMGCLAADNGVAHVMRKLAVMVDDVMRGEDLASMPVAINYREDLHLNVATMRQVNVSAPFELLFTASFVDPNSDNGLTPYGVRALIETALTENLDLRISKLDVSLARQEQRTAKSQYLPSVDLSSSYTTLNEEQTNALVGQAERTLTGSVQLNQLIFSEDATANIRIQSHLRQAEAAAQDQVALDVILGVFDGYFDVLRLKTNVAIHSESLAATRQNLELARVRVSLGASNRADLFRWESEVATATQAVITAHLQLEVAKRSLDTLVNNTLGRDYSLDDESIDGELYRSLSQGLIANQLGNAGEFSSLVDFLTEETKRRNPSKLQLEQSVLAVERRHQLNRRRFFVPTLSAGAALNGVFDRAGSGSVPLDGGSFSDDSWSASLNLTLPLFEGNRRRIDVQTTQLQKQQLQYQRGELDQRLSLAVLSSATDLLTASTNIGFSQVSAENTEKNFELLQDHYRQGTVSILDVLDAQTTALRAKQAYAVSVYEYMTALMTLENLRGEYSLLATPEGNQAFRRRFDAFVAKQKGQR